MGTSVHTEILRSSRVSHQLRHTFQRTPPLLVPVLPWQLELPGSVESRDVMAVADFFATGTGAREDSHNALLQRYREGQVHEVAVKPTRYIQRSRGGRARQN